MRRRYDPGNRNHGLNTDVTEMKIRKVVQQEFKEPNNGFALETDMSRTPN